MGIALPPLDIFVPCNSLSSAKATHQLQVNELLPCTSVAFDRSATNYSLLFSVVDLPLEVEIMEQQASKQSSLVKRLDS